MRAFQISLGSLIPSAIVNIENGDTESAAVQVAGMVPVGVILPPIFTGTGLSFLIGDSADGFQAKGEVLFSGIGQNNRVVTINGTSVKFLLVDPDPELFEIAIGSDAASQAQIFYDFVSASVDEGLAACTYELNDTVITITAKVAGTDGNGIGLSENSSGVDLSGANLTGGGFRPLYGMDGNPVAMTVAQDRAYAIDPANFQGILFLKAKSNASELGPRTLIFSLKGM